MEVMMNLEKRALKHWSGIEIQAAPGGFYRSSRCSRMEMYWILIVFSITFILSNVVDATYIQCAAAAGSNVANVQICPTGQCCGVNGYCGTGQGYCGKGNCLSQCGSAVTVSPPGSFLHPPPPPPLFLPPPPPQYYYTGGGSNIADLEYHDYHDHHHHDIDTVWKIVGIVAAIVALILLALILIFLVAKTARRHKHACECDHL